MNTMVLCKFYRQGNCRYGQYCKFEHINSFDDPKEYEDEIAVAVAKEILLAEKGGQWLLSCFGLFKERPCIPGMKDFSPEEIRWEMYQAQKSGMVEQAKLHFQQLCQDMKAKREALKNPTRETIVMLRKLLGSRKGECNASYDLTGKSPLFSFAAPRLGMTNITSTNNVQIIMFANKTFGAQTSNPFGGGGFASSNNTSSVFGKTNNNVMFGGSTTFGNNVGGFGTAASTSSIFGGTTNTLTSFNSAQNNTPTFGTPQNNSVFGSSQNMFGQSNNVFNGTNQLGSTSSTSLFNNPMTSQPNNSLFGSATTTTASLFNGSGSSSGMQTNLGFRALTNSSNSFNSSSIFNQPKSQLPAFGGTPVFGGVTNNYANNSSNSLFGSQTFGTPAISTSNIFGTSVATTTPAFGAPAATTTLAFGAPASTTTLALVAPAGTTTPAFGAATTTSTFGASAASTTPGFGASAATTAAAFGAPVVSATPAFGGSATTTTSAFGAPAATTSAFGTSVATVTPGFNMNQQPNNTFGTTVSSNVFGAQNTDTSMSMSNSAPFGAPLATAISSPFVTANSQQFDSTNSSSTPFTDTGFGMTVTSTNNTFGTTATSSNSIFANAGTTFATSNATVPNSSPFSNVNTSSPFSSPNATLAVATVATNPFAPCIPQSNTPFGSVAQNQLGINTSSPFGKSPFNVMATNVIIDDTVYSAKGSLTDDEKSMYLAEKFIIGKIPLKPPTKDIR